MSKRQPARVLVVANDSSTLSLLKGAFAEAGWEVRTAPDGPTALGICERTSFGLTMINLGLAGMSGSDLAALIAQRWPDTAVIIVGGRDDVTKGTSYLRAGVDDHVVAPLDAAEVVVRADRALERRRLILESRKHERELAAHVHRGSRTASRLFLGAMKSLAAALEAKDPYTRGHSERVSQLAREIASAMGAPEEEVKQIELGGQVHDIGKIGVREGVLSKPGSLTEEEMVHVRTHPVIGERILAPVLTDVGVTAIVRHHHEHYGGEGYPDGLRGSAIPLGARVLAVADAFDALTSDRPYRGRLTRESALDVLRAGAGSQWQPALVEALVRHLQEGNRNNVGR